MSFWFFVIDFVCGLSFSLLCVNKYLSMARVAMERHLVVSSLQQHAQIILAGDRLLLCYILQTHKFSIFDAALFPI